MKYKTYRSLFYFYNLIGILNMRFDCRKFEISKFLKYKSIIILTLVTVHTYRTLNHDLKLNSKVSKFSGRFLRFYNTLLNFILIIIMWIFFRNQKNLSKIFKIFLHLNEVARKRKIKFNLRGIKTKIWIFLSYVTFLIIVTVYFLLHILHESWSVHIEVLSNFLRVFNLMSIFSFTYFMLIHFELMLKIFNEVLEDRIDLVHSDCKDLLNILNLQKRLFELLNVSFQSLLPALVVSHLMNTIKVVRSFINQYQF